MSKYRVWAEENKQHFFEYFEIGENEDRYGRFAKLANKFSSIIEQYTGLKDKNGKEIYEGDIVKWLDGLNEYVVFRVEWQNNRARFCLRNEYSVYDYEDLSDKKKPYIEVIGNIHEPPKEFRPEHLKRMGVSMSKGGEE